MIPENELGVIVVFSEAAQEVGFRIMAIQTACPDAIIDKNGIEYRIEFEFKATNFLQHDHNPRKVDLIVCWQNDDPESTLPILELSNSEWKHQEWQNYLNACCALLLFPLYLMKNG